MWKWEKWDVHGKQERSGCTPCDHAHSDYQRVSRASAVAHQSARHQREAATTTTTTRCASSLINLIGKRRPRNTHMNRTTPLFRCDIISRQSDPQTATAIIMMMMMMTIIMIIIIIVIIAK